MNLPGYYSSGQFARMAQISVRTVRFYDKQNILKPSFVSDSGARFYTDSDFARLQQVLLLKHLGFSLDDIRTMTIGQGSPDLMTSSLKMQKKLVLDRIDQLQLVADAIDSTVCAIEREGQPDWNRMLNLIHLTGMEKSLRDQYADAANLSARIRLHRDFSQNRQGWFPWIYAQCDLKDGMNVLELGCGDGTLWKENLPNVPESLHVTLTDVSEGMQKDARRNIGPDDRFSYMTADCHSLPFADASFDLVIANHVLFYCNDLSKACREAARVLKPSGTFLCSTYGQNHMKEITALVQSFDQRIVLAATNLCEKFGLENGAALLSPYFSQVSRLDYEDGILIDRPEPLIEYILSCHGNQNQILLNRYKDFRAFVEAKTRRKFRITKEAGIFLCKV